MVSAEELQRHVERLRKRIGTTGVPATRKVEAGALIKFARATGQTDPIFLDEEQARRGLFGAVIAAPTYLSTFCADAMSGLIDLDLPLSMFLHTDDIVELGEPIRAGDCISAVARYADAYIREGRSGPLLFQITEMTLTNQNGEHVALVRVGTVSFDTEEGATNAKA
jgi:acyl dehydratase